MVRERVKDHGGFYYGKKYYTGGVTIIDLPLSMKQRGCVKGNSDTGSK